VARRTFTSGLSQNGGVAELVEIESGVVSGMSTQTIRR
jgi:hypothetical protein